MPIYEFHCSQCGKEFEELILNTKAKPVCPDCGCQSCDKMLSSFRLGPGGGGGSYGEMSTASTGSSSCGGCAATSCAGCGSR
jgi:putative FmdB family regulatory protein